MKKQKNITVHPRRLARQMARAELDHEKVTGYNKPTIFKGLVGPSRFAMNWKALAADISHRPPKPRKKKGANK